MVEKKSADDFVAKTVGGSSSGDPNSQVLRRTKTGGKVDAGIFWDEPLEIYRSGTINVNLYNNVLGFNAGD